MSSPVVRIYQENIQLAHGSGGELSNKLISELFLSAFGNDELNKMNDSAVLQTKTKKIAFSTDSFVVDPIFFPGGDIGKLAVHGTVNDLAMSGAVPKFLSCGFIIEEGFPISDLQKIVNSMKVAAEEAEVNIVTGDTKVVPKGKGDKLFINTSGIGFIEHQFSLGAECIQPDDEIIISGTIADHGMCILSQREQLSFEPEIESDTAPLNKLVKLVIDKFGSAVHAFRDPTRGGVAASLNEFAKSSNTGIQIEDELIPINKAVKAACEILGIDPLYVANEGKCLIVVERGYGDEVVQYIKHYPLAPNAAKIGQVSKKYPQQVQIKTLLGTTRFVDLPVGEQLPRIC
ncbi:MAG: hydrogenase expression/formation protein HypE [Calditrichaeota bacterium]|nr:MAG: hydrogenase expression/formation protein HypE [Calditrichota bacterium]